MYEKKWNFKRAIEVAAISPWLAILPLGLVLWFTMAYMNSVYPELEILASKGHGEYQNVIEEYSSPWRVLVSSFIVGILGNVYIAVVGIPISFILVRVGWNNRVVWVITCMLAGTAPLSLLVNFDALLLGNPIDVLLASYFYCLFLCTGLGAHWLMFQ